MIISRKEAIEKGLKVYFTGKPCKYGHVSERYVSGSGCLECGKEYKEQSKERIKEYFEEYYQQNKEQIKESRKEYYQQNKEQIKESRREYRRQNKEQINEYKKEYREQNKEQIKEYLKEYKEQNKEQINEYNRNRYATDDNFKTLILCRSMLQRTLKATNSTKDTRTKEMLGYCNEQLKESIESKFLEGMSWNNYGDWHIDHIYPVSRYIKDGVEDPSIINALDNLIPMWAEHNMEKSEKTLEEYLDDRKDLVGLYGVFKKKKR